MKTHLNITNGLERSILAQSLLELRKIEKPKDLTAKYFVFLSTLNGGAHYSMLSRPVDEVWVDSETWKIKEIIYQKWEGKKIISKTIPVND